jgi:hypothetical protein
MVVAMMLEVISKYLVIFPYMLIVLLICIINCNM